MSKKQKRRSEQYIHVEERSGSFRFKVTVEKQKDSGTFSTEDEGWRWARQRRQTFLDIRDNVGVPVSAVSSPASVPSSATAYGVPYSLSAPPPIKMADVLDSYEKHDLPKLSGKSSEKSRLVNLRQWFGERNLDQLDQSFIDRWVDDRLAGKLGSGRDPRRAETMSGVGGAKPLSKQQRYARKLAGKEVPALAVHPVSTQSVRHELSLLRRSVTKYLGRDGRSRIYGAWWKAHYLMEMHLPAEADPRSRRVSDAELVMIFDSISDAPLKASILMAVLTSLRRGEVASLNWEDVDWVRKVVRLRKPHSMRKTKVVEREIPLLPGALKLLQDMGPQTKGLIFGMPASSVSQGWRKAADKAKIFDARLHDCRREAISRLVELCQLSIHEVAAGFSGHTDIRTLQKHYLRLNSSLMAAKLAVNPAAANMAPQL
ncbi:site-specific integrase [Duganella sp. PWIR1]